MTWGGGKSYLWLLGIFFIKIRELDQIVKID